MSDELPAISLTGEQVRELAEQLRGMVDPLTGELHIEMLPDGLPLLEGPAEAEDPR